MQQTVRPLSDAYALAGAGRLPEAIEIIQSHAETGDGEALFTLGDMYWRGVGVSQDLEHGRELFRRSSDAGFPVGRRAFTNLLGNGRVGERDWPVALRRLSEEAASDGLRTNMVELLGAMELDENGDPSQSPPEELLSDRPFVKLYRGAFSLAECNFLRGIAEPTYQPTSVVIDPGATIQAFIRTAEGSTIHWLIEDPATHAMNRRLAAMTGTDVTQGEPLQILRYQPGQEYKPHFDWLDAPNPRVKTALVYLNDDYDGGETAFPRVGLKVKGQTGDVLVFESQGPDGKVDRLSEHAGLPVTSGIKYLGSRWIRARQFTL